MYDIWVYICHIFSKVKSIKNMSRKSEDYFGRRQSYSRLTRKRSFKEEIYKFLQDFKTEQVAVLDKLTNEVIELKGSLNETNNVRDKKEIRNKNDITYAELEFLPFPGHNKTKNDKKPSPLETDLQIKVYNLTKENEICNKRIDVLQNQLSLFQQKLQELEMKEGRMKGNDVLVQSVTETCQKMCYQHFRDVSHAIMAFWEGNYHVTKIYTKIEHQKILTKFSICLLSIFVLYFPANFAVSSTCDNLFTKLSHCSDIFTFSPYNIVILN